MSDTRDDEFDAYLAAAIQGDQAAVNFILRTIRPLVVRYCRARLGRTERTFASADDVAQEVCMAVLTALSTYRDQGRPFLAFVYGIAAHKVIDAHRAAGRNKFVPSSDLQDSPTQFDTPPALGDPFETWLINAQRELTEDLAGILDIDAGLTEITRVRQLDQLAPDLTEILDVEAGLAAILGAPAITTGSLPPVAAAATVPSTALPSTLPWDYTRETIGPHRRILREPEREVELSDGPEQRALQFESAGEMGRLLEVLPEKQREILVLRVVNGLSAEEAAEAVGSTPGAVRVAQHRALTRLRKAMAEDSQAWRSR